MDKFKTAKDIDVLLRQGKNIIDAVNSVNSFNALIVDKMAEKEYTKFRVVDLDRYEEDI